MIDIMIEQKKGEVKNQKRKLGKASRESMKKALEQEIFLHQDSKLTLYSLSTIIKHLRGNQCNIQILLHPAKSHQSFLKSLCQDKNHLEEYNVNKN